MMKNILACMLTLGFSAAALADDASATPATTTVHTPPAPGSRLCVQETGSHVPPRQGECLAVPGRSYSKEDLENTGSFSTSEALGKLDPSFRR